LETHAFAPRVREDFLSGVQSGVIDTPTFFINGLRHGGPWNLETLTAAIVAAVDSAKAASCAWPPPQGAADNALCGLETGPGVRSCWESPGGP
jgi:hypothetical protein